MRYRIHCKNLKTGAVTLKGIIACWFSEAGERLAALNEEDAGEFEYWLQVEEPLVDAVLKRWPGAKIIDVREPA